MIHSVAEMALVQQRQILNTASRKRKCPSDDEVSAQNAKIFEQRCGEIVKKLKSSGGQDKEILAMLQGFVRASMLDSTADATGFDSQLGEDVDVALCKSWQVSNQQAERCEQALDAVNERRRVAEEKIQQADRDIKSGKETIATQSKSLCKDTKKEMVAAKAAVKNARDEFEDLDLDVEEAQENKAKLEKSLDQVFNRLRYVGGGREFCRIERFAQIEKVADKFDFDESVVYFAEESLVKQPGCRGRFDLYVTRHMELEFKKAIAHEARLTGNIDAHREGLLKKSDEAMARLATARERQQTLKTSIKYAQKMISVQKRAKAATQKALYKLKLEVGRVETELRKADEVRKMRRMALEYFRMLTRRPMETN